ncbi:MAG TPA: GDSL-type esterase/lipase family protein [Vicinamibacterales bacterium]
MNMTSFLAVALTFSPLIVHAQRASRMVSIVALGDSTTAGTPAFRSPIEAPPNGAGDEHSQYAYWLMQKHPDWRVLNRGVDGERTDEIAARFDRDVLAAHPRVVIILAGVNDVYQGLPAERVTRELRAMYDRAIAAGIDVVAASIIPYNSATRGQNVEMHDINAWIAAQAAKDPRIAFVDTRAAVAAPGHADRLSGSPDGLHPDVDGYHRMADAIGPVVSAVLERHQPR